MILLLKYCGKLDSIYLLNSFSQLTDDMVSQLKFLEIAPQLGNIIGGCITGIAAILALVGGYLIFFKSNSQFVWFT